MIIKNTHVVIQNCYATFDVMLQFLFGKYYASSTDLAYRRSGSLISKYVVYVTSAVDLIKKCNFLVKSSKQLAFVVRSGKIQNSGYPKW